MTQCSITQSHEATNWPEGTISVKLTMNPYLLAMAFEQSLNTGTKLWEFVNMALWEKLGKPDQDVLMEFAADMEIVDEDPKWKKRLKITARHEVEMKKFKRQMGENLDPDKDFSEGNGNNG